MDKMKITLLLAILLSMVQMANAQRYISRNGHVWFYSYTPLENIEAHNQQVAGILDVSSGSMQFSLLIKSFEFKVALMEEHFNENYMESDKLPKAEFTGKITNIDQLDFAKDGSYPAEVTGDITIHGITKNITTTGMFVVSEGTITATSKFVVIPQDFDIEIPSLVRDKIAREIEVNVDITFIPN